MKNGCGLTDSHRDIDCALCQNRKSGFHTDITTLAS